MERLQSRIEELEKQLAAARKELAEWCFEKIKQEDFEMCIYCEAHVFNARSKKCYVCSQVLCDECAETKKCDVCPKCMCPDHCSWTRGRRVWCDDHRDFGIEYYSESD